MSTRTNILIQDGSTRIYLYRHCDGYPAGNGVDLAEATNASRNTAELLVNLLSRRYEKQSYQTEAQPVYEVTTDWHGDIEWAYQVDAQDRFAKKNRFMVGCVAIQIGASIEAATAQLKANQTPEEFTAYVKEEERRMELRIAAIEKARKVRR